MYRSVPAHNQTDPAKLPGQVRNPIPMTDQEVYRMMNPTPIPGTLGEYLRRKEDNHAGMPVSAGEAFCSRIMR